jgi:hypothetical protein
MTFTINVLGLELKELWLVPSEVMITAVHFHLADSSRLMRGIPISAHQR